MLMVMVVKIGVRGGIVEVGALDCKIVPIMWAKVRFFLLSIFFPNITFCRNKRLPPSPQSKVI